MTLTPENLLGKLKKEGSFEEYYRYLGQLYGIAEYGTHFNLQIKDEECTVVSRDEDFALAALETDIQHKSLEKINWIAEAEADYTAKAYLAALDRYHRLNADTYVHKEDLQEAVRKFEKVHNGKASFAYAPEHEHKDD
ncbi:hypothetical protein MFMK1_000205 [Metallumcola ferriviriculae]|uniref:Uncharacterized protein n=1 Tax=Metallumcola ferriviriculae TaxID=3039180 RepID=A0AAU0UJV2_9FIRM|nr:hypothetical protein MFMK1_000205 [Desulfitibacteraceae bacterium MK1]